MSYHAHWLALLCCSLLLAQTGCGPQDAIQTYESPKSVQANQAQPAAQAAAEPETSLAPEQANEPGRMLAAIVPDQDQLWFFKLLGAAEAVLPHSAGVEALFASIRPGDPAKGGLQWDTPEGWTVRGPEGMRLATLTPPGGGKSLELSVISLPSTGSLEDDLLNNVNRWRGQLGLPPMDATALKEHAQGTKPLGLEGLQGAISVDLTGSIDPSTLMAPRAGAPALGPIATNPPAPQFEPTDPVAAAPGSSFRSKLPDTWKPAPGRSMRVATYTVGDAEVVVSQFPKFGVMADPLENVNRWRGQVGLPPLDLPGIEALQKTMEIAGEQASYYELMGPEDASPPLGMLAAMTVRGDQVWFFKLFGPRAVVEAERERFVPWLSSIEFDQEPSN